MLADTHAHLDFPEFDHDRGEAIARALSLGIRYIVNVGSSLDGSRKSVELAATHECVWAAVGIHPHEADTSGPEAVAALRELSRAKKVVAVGEIGLDYFKNYSSRQNQQKLFESLVALAKESGLPVIIHCRQAEDDTLAVLRSQMPLSAVFHCFSGDEPFLKQCLDLGFLVSFTCNIGYKKAEGLRGLVRSVPLERVMLETDAPFLSPEGLRGRRNEPANVRYLCEQIAALRGMSPEGVAEITTANARRFFKL